MVMGWIHVQSFIAIRCFTWDRVHPNRQFLRREPTFLSSKKRVFGVRVISHLMSDGLQTLKVCIWWWDGPRVQSLMAIRCRTWDRVRPNRQFLCREPTFLYSKKRGIWVHAISRSISDGHETLHVYIWWWDGPACKVSRPSDVEREIACAQIANFYVGNLHFRIVKSRGFGHARDLIFGVG